MADSFKRLQDQAYDYVLDKILSGEFSDDSLYSETSLSEDLQISRTPLHNALLQLSQEGYIDILPSRGFSLRRMTPKDLKEIYQVCVALEGFCVFRLSTDRNMEAAKKTIQQLDRIISIQERITTGDRNVESFIKYDYDFHYLIISYVDNTVFINRFRNYRNRINKYLIKSMKVDGRMDISLSEHRKIWDNIKKGDIGSLMECIEIHHDDFRRQKI